MYLTTILATLDKRNAEREGRKLCKRRELEWNLIATLKHWLEIILTLASHMMQSSIIPLKSISLEQLVSASPPTQKIVTLLVVGGTRSIEVRLPIFPFASSSSNKVATFPDSIIGGLLTLLSPGIDKVLSLTLHTNIPVLVVLHSNIPLLPGHITTFPLSSVVVSVPDPTLHNVVEPKIIIR